jgi:hypothetical protein
MQEICRKYADKYTSNMPNMQNIMTNMQVESGESIVENIQENLQNMQNTPTMPKICKICIPYLADGRSRKRSIVPPAPPWRTASSRASKKMDKLNSPCSSNCQARPPGLPVSSAPVTAGSRDSSSHPAVPALSDRHATGRAACCCESESLTVPLAAQPGHSGCRYIKEKRSVLLVLPDLACTCTGEGRA